MGKVQAVRPSQMAQLEHLSLVSNSSFIRTEYLMWVCMEPLDTMQ